ncbi:MAG: TIGR03545 family protein [Gammaproteobacteria bacterium]|nr:TIGR03545 family protein [Gammaproteobacteria bacterium]
MMTWLRWQGALAFIAIVVFSLVVTWFFLDDWIEYNIESLGEELVGAKVTLDDVETILSPLGVKLIGLEVADKAKPFENLVQVDQISVQLQGTDLLMGQVIINDMQLRNMQFSTERKVSGGLSVSQQADIDDETAASPRKILDQVGITLPDPDEILKNEKLQSISVGKALETEYQHCIAVSERARRSIPDKEKLKNYEDRLSEILKGKITSLDNYRQRKQLLNSLRDEIKASKRSLLEAKKALMLCRKNLAAQVKELKGAPESDLRRLKEKYQLSGEGAENVSKMLFGEQAQQWFEAVLVWYEKLAPVLLANDLEAEEPERSAGRVVYFPSFTALPDFLIRHAAISISLPQGKVLAELNDITHQPEVLGRPVRLKVFSESLQSMDELLIEGSFDHVNPKEAYESLDFTLHGIEVSELELLSVDGNAIVLSKALADLKATLVVHKGEVNVNSETVFHEAVFLGGGKKGFVRELGLALKGVHEFNLNASVKGALRELDVDINSNLDSQLAKAFSRRLKQKQKKLEKELEEAINARVAAFLQEEGIDADQFNIDSHNLSKALDNNREYLEELLNEELSDFEAQQKIEFEKKKKAELERAKRKSKEKLKKQFKKMKINF